MHRPKALISVIIGKEIHESLDFAEFFILAEKTGFSVLYGGSLLGFNLPSFIEFIDGNVDWSRDGVIGVVVRKSNQPDFRAILLNNQVGDLVGHFGRECEKDLHRVAVFLNSHFSSFSHSEN